jgi:hypothetical protein
MKNIPIGEFAYPRDNSWAYNLTKNEACTLSLAGVWGTEAKEVKVISEPYIHKIESWGKSSEHEFVNVEYENQTIRILNNFHDSQLSMIRRVESEILNDGLFGYKL